MLLPIINFTHLLVMITCVSCSINIFLSNNHPCSFFIPSLVTHHLCYYLSPVLVVTLLTGWCLHSRSSPACLQPHCAGAKNDLSWPRQLRHYVAASSRHQPPAGILLGPPDSRQNCSSELELQHSQGGSLGSIHYHPLILAVIRSKLHVWISH